MPIILVGSYPVSWAISALVARKNDILITQFGDLLTCGDIYCLLYLVYYRTQRGAFNQVRYTNDFWSLLSLAVSMLAILVAFSSLNRAPESIHGI